MSDSKTKKVTSFIFAKKKDSKIWGDAAKNRFIKQHGSVEDIPEGDAHAVPKYTDPTLNIRSTPEETKTAADKLEEQIKVLKDPPKPPPAQTTQKPQKKGFYDDWID